MPTVVSIAGLAVKIVTDDERRWSAVDAVFGGCQPCVEEPVISVRFDDNAPLVPSTEPDEVVNGLARWFDHGVIAARHESGLAGCVVGDAIHVGGPVDLVDLDRAFRVVVQYALIEAFASHDRHALHAAAIQRDGSGVVVIGGMGAGKSTLCYAAACSGWDVLTDDIAWITDADRIEVSGFPKPLNVPEDCLVAPPAGARLLDIDARRRWKMPNDFVRPDGAFPLVGIVFVDHSNAAGRVEQVPSGPQLVQPILQGYPLLASPIRTRAFVRLAVRMSRLPAVALLLDAEPLRRVGVAAETLSQTLFDFVGGSGNQ